MRPSRTGSLSEVDVLVFYDENGNGVLDPGEDVRIPNVEVQLGSTVGRTVLPSGVAVLRAVPSGQQELTIQPSSLPPFYLPPPPVAVAVPVVSGEIQVPIRLPIDGNRPNTYMAFGDSITEGDGSSDGTGYRGPLQMQLAAYLGRAALIDQGIGGTRTDTGASRIGASLAAVRPAYTVVHYGTNDWYACSYYDTPIVPCFTIDNLRTIVRAVKAQQSLPILATIIPTNVGYDARTPPERNEWVSEIDDLIRKMATDEGAVLADLHAAFLGAAGNDLSQLFSDHVHPNDAGYAIMARELFRAITGSPVTSSGALTARGRAATTLPDSSGPTIRSNRPAHPSAPERE